MSIWYVKFRREQAILGGSSKNVTKLAANFHIFQLDFILTPFLTKTCDFSREGLLNWFKQSNKLTEIQKDLMWTNEEAISDIIIGFDGLRITNSIKKQVSKKFFWIFCSHFSDIRPHFYDNNGIPESNRIACFPLFSFQFFKLCFENYVLFDCITPSYRCIYIFFSERDPTACSQGCL